MLSLFFNYIGSIVCHASQVWGSRKCDNIESVHLEYCKRILGAKRSTSYAMVYCVLDVLDCLTWSNIGVSY